MRRESEGWKGSKWEVGKENEGKGTARWNEGRTERKMTETGGEK